MGTKNAFGKRMQEAALIYAKNLIAEQTMARLQIGRDAAVLAAHEVFGLGPGRAQAFADAYSSAMDELKRIRIRGGNEGQEA